MYDDKYSKSKFELIWLKYGRENHKPLSGDIENDIAYRKELLLSIEKNNQILLEIMNMLNRRLK